MEYSEPSLNQPAQGPIEITGFVRLSLQRNVRQELKKSANNQKGLVF
jgi:hypothetical protein